jgi:RNA polymerase sigma-70 factor, ECF subfamily
MANVLDIGDKGDRFALPHSGPTNSRSAPGASHQANLSPVSVEYRAGAETNGAAMIDSERSREFTENLGQCHRKLFNYIFVLVRDLEDAHDVFQETSMLLWKKYDEFQPGTNFAAWAYNVAQFKASEFLRSKRRHRVRFSGDFAQLLAATDLHSDPEGADVWQDLLNQCIEKLPSHQRELLHDCYSGAQSVAEVAASLGRPTRGLYNSLRSIRERLLKCIEGVRLREYKR